MLASILESVSAGELLGRMGATAFVVIAMSVAIGRFGPLIGGALAGLPVVVGPGFYFLISRAPPDFVEQAAGYSILSLCATQSFLLAYIVVSSRAAPWTALGAGTAAWLATAIVLRPLALDPWSATALFAVLTGLARWGSGRFRRETVKAKRDESIGLVLLRGALAGLLVAVVTSAARGLGPEWSGLFMAYPIGFTVISFAIHRQFGSATVIATLHSAMLGVAALVGFCATLALTVMNMPPYAAFGTAIGVSVVITLGLLVCARPRHPTSSLP